MTTKQKTLKITRTPSKFNTMIKIIKIGDKKIYLKKKFDKQKKILFWSVAKIENL